MDLGNNYFYEYGISEKDLKSYEKELIEEYNERKSFSEKTYS